MKQYRANDLEITAQATEWLHAIKNNDGRAREGFTDWLLESRRHVRAALLTIAVQKELEQLDPHQLIDVHAMLAAVEVNVVEIHGDSTSSSSMGQSSHSESTSRPRPGYKLWIGQRRWLGFPNRIGQWSLVAALVCVVVVGSLSRWYMSRQPQFATTTGQQQSLKLDDGSVVHLNTQTRIQVEFSRRGRDVQLLAGEALFNVQHEIGRPFEVHVGNAVVKALGTEFNVDRHEAQVTVSVVEGHVQICSGTQPSRVLSAGEEARIDAQGSVRNIETPNIKRRVAWRERRLEFQDDTLGAVVAEFNRYNRTPQLRLEGAGIGSRTYTGIFSADDPNSLVQVLEEERDLDVRRKGDNIVIRARHAAEAGR